jgi:hypothetical protein
MSAPPTGLMVIRVWIEEGSSNPLRAVIRHTSDVSSGFSSATTLSEADRVLDEVKAFLAKVTHQQT